MTLSNRRNYGAAAAVLLIGAATAAILAVQGDVVATAVVAVLTLLVVVAIARPLSEDEALDRDEYNLLAYFRSEVERSAELRAEAMALDAEIAQVERFRSVLRGRADALRAAALDVRGETHRVGLLEAAAETEQQAAALVSGTAAQRDDLLESADKAESRSLHCHDALMTLRANRRDASRRAMLAAAA